MSLPARARMAATDHEARADELDRLVAYHEHMATLVDGPLAPYLASVHLDEATTLRARAATYRAASPTPPTRRTYPGR